MKLRSLFLLAAAALPPMAATLPAGAADTLGQKPVMVIVPLPPGGPNDAELKLYFNQLSGKLLPQQFIMDFKPGAAGIIGGTYVTRSAPDGHTLQMISSSFTTIPAMHPDLPFDTMKDYTHLSQMSLKHFVLGIHPSLPIKTMPDYIAYSRTNPDKINFVTTGSGGSAHLAGAWLHNLINTKATFVHYKGGTQGNLDVIAGRAQAGVMALQSNLGLISAGKIRPVALMGRTRSDALPGVPTIAETVPGFSFESYIGLSGPARIPAGVVKQLSEAFMKAAKMPEVVKTLESQGSVAVGSTPEEFSRVLQAETDRWKKVVKDNNIKLEE